MFVANREGDSVSDMKALHVIATVPVGHAPLALTVSPGRDRLYVTNVQSSDLSVLGAETLETLDTVNRQRALRRGGDAEFRACVHHQPAIGQRQRHGCRGASGDLQDQSRPLSGRA